MGFFGGIFGVLFGWLIGRALTVGTNAYLQRQNLNPIELSSVPWWLILSAIAFAIVVSLAAGLYPASRAAKLNPLRYGVRTETRHTGRIEHNIGVGDFAFGVAAALPASRTRAR